MSTMNSAPHRTYLNATRGVWAWLTTLDHKRIALMYLVLVSVALLLGGIFAALWWAAVHFGRKADAADAVRASSTPAPPSAPSGA